MQRKCSFRRRLLCARTDINHFVRERRKLVAETELVHAIFFGRFLHLIVLLLRFFVENFTRRTFQLDIDIIITTGNHLRTRQGTNERHIPFGVQRT